MKARCAIFLFVVLLGTSSLWGAQATDAEVSVATLLASPESFGGRWVRVHGFLVIEKQPKHASLTILYLDQDVARRQETRQGVLVVVPVGAGDVKVGNAGKEVTLTGRCSVVHAINGAITIVLEDVRDIVVSGAKHPSSVTKP